MSIPLKIRFRMMLEGPNFLKPKPHLLLIFSLLFILTTYQQSLVHYLCVYTPYEVLHSTKLKAKILESYH